MDCISYRLKGLTPIRSMIRDALVTPIILALWFLSFYALWNSAFEILSWLDQVLGVDLNKWHLWVGAIFSPIITFPLLYWFLSRLFSVRMLVHVNDKSIRFRGTVLNRKLGLVRFLLKEHPWGEFEKTWHDNVRHLFKARLPWLRRYFQRSFILYAEENGVRTVVTPLYGKRISARNLGKLNALLMIADGNSGTGRGASEDPGRTWSDQAGDF